MQQIQAFVPAVASAVSRSTGAPEQRSGVTLEDGASLLSIHYVYSEFWLHLTEKHNIYEATCQLRTEALLRGQMLVATLG